MRESPRPSSVEVYRHGKPFPPDLASRASKELGGGRNLVVRGPLSKKIEVPPGPSVAAPAGWQRTSRTRTSSVAKLVKQP